MHLVYIDVSRTHLPARTAAVRSGGKEGRGLLPDMRWRLHPGGTR